MTRISSALLVGFALLPLGGCSSSNEGERLFSTRHDDGNVFACATCHAESEPAADGLIRPGHPIGDAATRPSFKNGAIDNLLAAVNTCRVEWMGATEWVEESAEWAALSDWFFDRAPMNASPALAIEIAQPPADLSGGSAATGKELFNGRCIVCHGTDGNGTNLGPAVSGRGLAPEYVAERIRLSGLANSPTYTGLTGGRMPFWGRDRLSDDELIDIVAFVTSNSSGTGNSGGGGTTTERRDCSSTHPKIGQMAVLNNSGPHGVSGTARIVDDCTLEITNFMFDATGIDVRVYAGVDGNYANGFALGEDLRRSTPYTGDTLVVQLPLNRSWDDLNGISIWCIPARENFGDGAFL